MDKATLIAELLMCRQYLMNQIADMCEEQGDLEEARGWRWLGEYGKFPSKRKGGYGWSFTNLHYFEGGAKVLDATIQKAKSGGPTVLPYALVHYKLMKTTPLPSYEGALQVAAKAMGKLLARMDRETS